VAAILALSLYAANELMQISIIGQAVTGEAITIALFVGLFYLNAVRGAFAYRRFKTEIAGPDTAVAATKTNITDPAKVPANQAIAPKIASSIFFLSLLFGPFAYFYFGFTTESHCLGSCNSWRPGCSPRMQALRFG